MTSKLYNQAIDSITELIGLEQEKIGHLKELRRMMMFALIDPRVTKGAYSYSYLLNNDTFPKAKLSHLKLRVLTGTPEEDVTTIPLSDVHRALWPEEVLKHEVKRETSWQRSREQKLHNCLR